MFLSLGRTLRLGLSIADSFRQHLAELVLGLCGFPLKRPLGHGQHIGTAAHELKGDAAPPSHYYPNCRCDRAQPGAVSAARRRISMLLRKRQLFR